MVCRHTNVLINLPWAFSCTRKKNPKQTKNETISFNNLIERNCLSDLRFSIIFSFHVISGLCVLHSRLDDG